MRWVLLLSSAAASTVSFAASPAAFPASAGLVPINRSFGERTVPRVHEGTIRIPVGHAHGTVRVIVRLTLPPLAAALGRTTASSTKVRRLDVESSSSRAYMARERAAQARTIAALRRAIPDAKVGRRFGILLDGITVKTTPNSAYPICKTRLVKFADGHFAALSGLIKGC